jgi:hypothetical protein
MRLETQFSIFMVNKPGMLAKVLNEFAKAKVNIVALTVMDSVEHGVLRMVNGNCEKVRKILERLNMPYNETEVLCINLNNKAGALALITQKLAEARINLSYAYCTAGARGGRTTGVLKVADVKKAMKILRGHTEQKAKSKPALRRSPASRR